MFQPSIDRPFTSLLRHAFLVLILAAIPAFAQQDEVLYSFGANPGPDTGVTFDAAGNIYGTQGANVYKLTPLSGGGYSESTIYSFPAAETAWGTLAMDASGNLFGVTTGSNNGTVFKLSPSGSSWTETTLYTFPASGTNGINPNGDLVLDSAGNIYGTTQDGGKYGSTSSGGTAWELSPKAAGGYSFKLLHNFGNGTDGNIPFAGLIRDAAGNLYGTTVAGGPITAGFGTAFELMPQSDGTWKEKRLHAFLSGNDGQGPRARLMMDSAGDLYGTTVTGGRQSLGTAFELIPQSNGSWIEKILHNFGSVNDGGYLYSNLVFDSAGNLYGTTFSSQATKYFPGIVFELMPQSNGTWTEKIIHAFGGGSGSSTDGIGPVGDVVFGPSGQLVGTTAAGGSDAAGTVWQITF